MYDIIGTRKFSDNQNFLAAEVYIMYKTLAYHQISFTDFNQSCGMQLDPSNEWVVLADRIHWGAMEGKYSERFPSPTGRPAKPFRMALGALIIQKRKGLSDRMLVKEIAENPYLQYFLGLNRFKSRCPFTAPALVSFRKRITAEFLMEANELFLKDSSKATSSQKKTEEAAADREQETIGTQIIDATCSPSNIKFPQDFELLNKARMKLEEIIDFFCKTYGLKKPRTYRQTARKEYLALAKTKRRPAKKIRAFIRKHLGYLKRNIGYLQGYLSEGYEMPEKYKGFFETIQKLYEQQKYMFDHHTHRVAHRIVSISQPWVRPIVRGKAKNPTEFGAKYDVSLDEHGNARIEKISFEPYNESTIFKDAVERYKERTGHYPKRVLVDQIYRTRENRAYCKEHGIRMSGPKLGRPAKEYKATKEEYQDHTDRIEVERFFSLAKGSYGAGLIKTRLEETTLQSIALSVLTANMFRMASGNIFLYYFMDPGEEYGKQYYIRFDDAA